MPDHRPTIAFEPVALHDLPSNAVAAATLIIMRPGHDGADDGIVMLRRTPAMAFAPGAWVFPGGRVDDDDRMLGARLAPLAALDVDDAAARIAAIRETIEEAGIAPALAVDGAVIARWRGALKEGTPFSALLGGTGRTPDLAELVPYARWCPNFRETRVFDTRFYLWRAPADAEAADCDEQEHDRIEWRTAADAISEADAGQRHHIFPTACNLARLAAAGTYDRAVEDARRHRPVPMVVPAKGRWGGQDSLELPGNAGYPVTRHLVSALRRG